MLKHGGITNQHDINENLITSDHLQNSKPMELGEQEPFPFQNDVLQKLTIFQKIQVLFREILKNCNKHFT